MKNHLGSYECKLCLTLHNNEGCYLAHTQGKKHQANLAQRAAKEAKEAPAQPAPEKARVDIKRFVKIGRPGYKVTKQRDPDIGQQSLLFQIDYPEIVEGVIPRHRFMSAYEQKMEPPDKRWQYLLFAAEPYETIAFKVPSREVDKDSKKFWTHWNRETKQFFMQFAFKMDIKMLAVMQTTAPAVSVQKLPPSLPPPPQNAQSSVPAPATPQMSLPPPANLPPPPTNLPPRPATNIPPPSAGPMRPPPGIPPPPSGVPGGLPPPGLVPPPRGAPPLRGGLPPPIPPPPPPPVSAR